MYVDDTVYFDRISRCRIGDHFGEYVIKNQEDLGRVKSFFEQHGARVTYENGYLKIAPSLYLIATSSPYSFYEMDVGSDEIWIKFWGTKCTSGVFYYNGQVLYVTEELAKFLKESDNSLTCNVTCGPSLMA